MRFTTRPTLRGTFGMVSSTHWLASQAGMAELEAGGNAFDAVVAAAFVLHVVEPHMNGPGGEVPAIFARADDPRPTVLCGQGVAPAAATIEHYQGLGLDLVPGAGPLAATVPGAVDAWLTLLRDHGTRSLSDVLRYAIEYADDGHPLAPSVVEVIDRVSDLFIRHWPSSATVWLPDGGVPRPYTRFRNPGYAGTLRRLVAAAGAGGTRESRIDAARETWRTGFVARSIADFQRIPHLDSSGHDHPGLITVDDMAGWQASYEPPALGSFRGYTIAKTGPWGQGPVLLQALAMLDGYDDAALDPDTTDGVHLVIEALKLAFADREAWYGDTGEVPIRTLLSAGYAAQRRALINSRASTELRPGLPDGRTPRLPGYVTGAGPGFAVDSEAAAALGEPTLRRHDPRHDPRRDPQWGDTCHVDVVDRWGNIISATPSGGWLQSSPTIPELGFCLGSRAQMFWLEPGLPASLRPGARPRTTLTPTLVLRAGTPVLACGSPGGDQQDQWQLLFLLRHLVGGLELQAAIDAPNVHTTSLPSSFHPRQTEPGGLVVEDRIGPEVIADLTGRGHRVQVSEPWSLGRMCAVARDPETDVVSAAANPRGMQGYACGR
ncbi:MAG TPA: gamma-glutamyltransferase [Micromonosporaceae bacterium]|jgi:gamma-glutamyltranspeptidase/glutathione hydrolase|nr:gamma-glutamyltransferase [Micromonosporaceae bacterium]